MVAESTKLQIALSVLAPDIRDELSTLLQRAEDMDALATAIRRYGFMGDVDLGNGVVSWYAATVPPEEQEDFDQLLPALARIMTWDPAFVRPSRRIIFTPHVRSWQIALCHLFESIEALRLLRLLIFTEKTSGENLDALAMIEYLERNIFPAWKEKLRQQSTNPYRRYLQTEHWRRVRLDAIGRASNLCGLCGSSDRLEVHHKSYENLWDERPDDLITLCRNCHAKFHDKRP